MSSNPPGFISRQASRLGDMLADLNFLFPPELDDNETTESESTDTETASRISSDEENDAEPCENLNGTTKDVENDSATIEAVLEWKQTKPDINAESSTASSNEGRSFIGEKVPKIVKCLKLVINVCSTKVPLKKLSLQARTVIDEAFDRAADAIACPEVLKALVGYFRNNPQVEEEMKKLGEDMDAVRTPPEEGRVRRWFKRTFSGNRDVACTDPWYKRFLAALWTLCKQLLKLSGKAISLIVESIMVFLDVARAFAKKIFEAIKAALLWLRRSVHDPQGEINRILEDPKKSSSEKAIGVIGVVATAIVGTLILAFGISEIGPYGVGAAAAGAGAVAIIAMRTMPPSNREQP